MKSISRKDGTSFVLYLIRAENGLVKIGIASDPYERLNTLNVGSPVNLELIYHVYTAFAKEIEKKLHLHFKSKRIKGEWYSLSDKDINEITNTYGENGIISEYEL